MGHIYFKVSEHLHKPVSWVIKHKFHPDVKFLIIKYGQIIRDEINENEKIKEELQNTQF